MDRSAIKELFAYIEFCWGTHGDAVVALGAGALSKPVPGSGWPALRNAFGHTLLAYDDWLSEMTGTAMIGLKVDSVDSWDDLESCRRLVRGRFRNYLDSLSDSELATPREMDVDDEILLYSPADILVNLLLHERGHHGDVSTLLYQLGVEPPLVEYRQFLSEPTPLDRAIIEELFAYTDFSWREHERTIGVLREDALRDPVPGSGWPALRDALVHVNWAYDRWLLHPDRTIATAPEVESVRSWDDLELFRRRVRGRLRGYLDSLGDSELTTPREMDVDGEMLLYSPADIFVHVLLHERGHHGDISTLLYQLGAEPPLVDYRFFLLAHRASLRS